LDSPGLRAENCCVSEWVGKQRFLERYFGEDLPAERLSAYAYTKRADASFWWQN